MATQVFNTGMIVEQTSASRKQFSMLRIGPCAISQAVAVGGGGNSNAQEGAGSGYVSFDELTPTEHLVFFARIRGMPEDKIAGEVKTILGDIDLAEKADELAGSLSGGQKRKLSVGIALIGDPKIIFLDEPTAGVDPYSRR